VYYCMRVKNKIMSSVYEDETNPCTEKWGSESGSTLNAYYSRSTSVYIIMNTYVVQKIRVRIHVHSKTTSNYLYSIIYDNILKLLYFIVDKILIIIIYSMNTQSDIFIIVYFLCTLINHNLKYTYINNNI